VTEVIWSHSRRETVPQTCTRSSKTSRHLWGNSDVVQWQIKNKWKQWRRTEFEGWGAPVQGKSGGTDLAQSAGNFFGSKSTISRFGDRFRDGQYSLFSFLFAVFLYSRCPRAQPFVKVGARAPVPRGAGATAWKGVSE